MSIKGREHLDNFIQANGLNPENVIETESGKSRVNEVFEAHMLLAIDEIEEAEEAEEA